MRTPLWIIAFLLVMASATNLQGQPALAGDSLTLGPRYQDRRISCQLQAHELTIRAPSTRRPTYFAILAPGDRTYYIVYPPDHIDHLKENYRKDPIVLDIATQTGSIHVHDNRAPIVEKIFSQPGEYELVFTDANGLENEAIHSMKCSVNIPADALTDGRPLNLPRTANCTLPPKEWRQRRPDRSDWLPGHDGMHLWLLQSQRSRGTLLLQHLLSCSNDRLTNNRGTPRPRNRGEALTAPDNHTRRPDSAGPIRRNPFSVSGLSPPPQAQPNSSNIRRIR